MKKISVVLLFCTTFLFSQEITDTLSKADSSEIVADTANLHADKIIAQDIEHSKSSTLTIISVPDSASILINRKKVGNSPYVFSQINPDIDKYNLMILKDGFELLDTTVILQNGATDTLLLKLVPENQANDSAKQQDVLNAAKAESDTTAMSAEDLAKKKKKMDRVGIIVFLSIMVAMMGMQEYNNH